MKKIVLALLLITLASVGIAQACGDSIYDIQTNPALEGTLGVPCDVIVTATRYNGFFGQQATTAVNPNGEYSGIWVYTGTDPGVVVGDVLAICGEIKEYNGLTEIDVVAAGVYGYVTNPAGVGPPLAPHIVDAATVAADGEPWESVQIMISDGMEVPVGFDLDFGEWNVVALDGTVLQFDDYWYDFLNVMEGQCYNNATGIYTFGFGAFKLEPYADGIPIVDCAVGVEALTMGAVKAMYR